MDQKDSDIIDYTNAAWEYLYETVDSKMFAEYDSEAIYNMLESKMKILSFGDYLKRYIYIKSGMTEEFGEVGVSDYQQIIKYSFAENRTPVSFTPTTAKLSALSKNWLTQQTVRRNVVFLLGFGLNMSAEDVNLFLTKAVREPGINPKNPFEVICWYCFKNHLSFHRYEKLTEAFEELKTEEPFINISEEYTIGLRNGMNQIRCDEDLMLYLARLKTKDNKNFFSMTALNSYKELFEKSRELAVDLLNEMEENSGKYSLENVSESDLERILCASIPLDRYGNLAPEKASKLNAQFFGRRFSRQRVGEILAGNTEVNRFDLMTLNFFIFSQKCEEYSNNKKLFYDYVDSTNEILNKCSMGTIYVQNPYECFLMMCMISEDPLGTYADVWEMSYMNEEDE